MESTPFFLAVVELENNDVRLATVNARMCAQVLGFEPPIAVSSLTVGICDS